MKFTAERQAVAEAVLEGVLGAEYLTWDEIMHIKDTVDNLVMDRKIEQAMNQGKTAFSGIEGDRLQ
jgi:hypothetical protein